MFVILGGATTDRTKIKLPRFSRFTWSEDFPGTLLCISDPSLTLDPDIRLAWYFGNLQNDATQGLVTVVETVASAIDVQIDRVSTYGSSGGGFAALQLAARLGRGATAIAINAQTNILNYEINASVDKFFDVCLDGLSKDLAQAQYAERLSALEAWSLEPANTARCLLVQNTRDYHHYVDHLQPFTNRFGIELGAMSQDYRLGCMLYDHPSGHAAEPRELLPTIFQRANQLKWSQN